jgi:hypothetical protein
VSVARRKERSEGVKSQFRSAVALLSFLAFFSYARTTHHAPSSGCHVQCSSAELNQLMTGKTEHTPAIHPDVIVYDLTKSGL